MSHSIMTRSILARSILALLISRVVWISLLLVTASVPSMGQEPEEQGSVGTQIRNLGWKAGPSDGKIAGRATITIPANYVFLGAADTSKFLTLMRNLPRTDSYTFAPQDLSWFSIFDFEDTGYIKDDEKIDADAVLQSLKEGTTRNNEERKRRGFPQQAARMGDETQLGGRRQRQLSHSAPRPGGRHERGLGVGSGFAREGHSRVQDCAQ